MVFNITSYFLFLHLCLSDKQQLNMESVGRCYCNEAKYYILKTKLS